MRKRYLAAVSLAVTMGLSYFVGSPGPGRSAGAAEAPVSFKQDVLPIFQNHCVACHHTPDGEGYKASGLDLTTYEAVMKGTKYGPMIAPGHPEYSNLMWLLDWRAAPQLRMPHNEMQLPGSERNTIRTWIQQGAKNN